MALSTIFIECAIETRWRCLPCVNVSEPALVLHIQELGASPAQGLLLRFPLAVVHSALISALMT